MSSTRRNGAARSSSSWIRRDGALTDSTLFGAVLTGGTSRRMGRDKALVEIEGSPMAARVVRALQDTGCSTVLAIGGRSDDLAVLGVPVVADDAPGEGPLGGIATALRVAGSADPYADVLAVACDLPYLRPADLARLAEAARRRSAADAVVARSLGRQPTCALWRPSSRATVLAAFADGERAVHAVLDALAVVDVELPAASLRNINVPADLPGYP